ncbi:hypothetical protein GCM10010435_49120 [Winogradskya consettensis]|uniref:DUF3618 domain-containing protein n=1 Tax=Winogradskya consettensis TaxID=113560 RepID=A0A919SI54_9ACTN|nr:hypothetical protein [Actinoplanes consettensis]GIM73185.1 hypothetical protein Aco04nite_34050 [Actinoplanes consettensis]
MSDFSSGARFPDEPFTDPAYPVSDPYTTPVERYPARSPSTADTGGDDSKARQVADQTSRAAGEVKDTAKEQAQKVAGETRAQARNVASDVRDKVGEQARTQNDKLVGTIRETADQLDEMRGDRQDSPAAAVVSRVADGGRQLADYLDRNGPDGVLREVQDFARRRPGAFLATALAAGFVVGRLGKGVAKADPGAGADKPHTDSFESFSTGGTDYPTGGTDYPTGGTDYAATGTGVPVVVSEESWTR